jgi:predicted nuclease of restriction endonuclease-like (RecB) superfamily
MSRTSDKLPASYPVLLEDIKSRIRSARIKAALSINRELIELYWDIGKCITERQKQEGWGKSVVERLATDLRNEFLQISGFSSRNIWRMRAFYLAWTEEVQKLTQVVAVLDGENLPQPVAEIPWGHNILLLEKIKHPPERLWYAVNTKEFGWSRAVLTHQVESDLYGRQGKAITNFTNTLPALQSDLANQLLKDPYHLDFLAVGPDVTERQLEMALLKRLKVFILELGKGFAFVGNQVHLEVGGKDYYVDLLFYHLRLRCYVVIDLKIEEFKPEFAGKMNFYLAAVDDLMRHPDDKPSIGLILCKDKNRIVVEYALRSSKHPVGVAEYKITKRLPKKFQSELPTPEELRKQLRRDQKFTKR